MIRFEHFGKQKEPVVLRIIFNYFFALNRIAEAERPVKLQRTVYGYVSTGNSFQFNLKLTYELPNIVKGILNERIDDRQILVFCQSRNDVEKSLEQLLKDIQQPIVKTQSHRAALEKVAEK